MAEAKLAELAGVRNVILTCNGTAATHLLFKALKFKHPQVKRLVFPNNVYVAVWNAALFDREDWECVAVDANLDTWNADYESIGKAGPETAFVIVHNVGNVVNVPRLKRLYPESVFIEDNCEGFLGGYEYRPAGSESLCSSISFFGNKTITSGEGGAFLTNDDSVASYIRRIFSQGQTDQLYVHDVLAYNYRMSNIQAALLLGQLTYLSKIRHEKARVFYVYKKLLNGLVQFPVAEEGTYSSDWMVSIRLPGWSAASLRDLLARNSVETRPMFYPIDMHAHLSSFKVLGVKNAFLLSQECLILPSYPELSDQEIDYICSLIKVALYAK